MTIKARERPNRGEKERYHNMNRQQFKRIARDGYRLSEADCPDSRLDELYDEAERRIEKFKHDYPLRWEMMEVMHNEQSKSR